MAVRDAGDSDNSNYMRKRNVYDHRVV